MAAVTGPDRAALECRGLTVRVPGRELVRELHTQFLPGTERCVMDRRPPGYRWLSLHEDGSVSTRVGWLPDLVGTPRDESESRR